MPSVQDEEESLCLLASDLQDPVGGKSESEMADCKNPEWLDEDSEKQASLLSQGNAEKAFFNVCKTNEDEEDDSEDCVEVMNDIIGTLEAEIEAPNEVEESRNSRSLVVDIHLPPADDEDEKEAEIEQPQQPATRPCKHEVNRFQRCYSDGSQASPKKKAKV